MLDPSSVTVRSREKEGGLSGGSLGVGFIVHRDEYLLYLLFENLQNLIGSAGSHPILLECQSPAAKVLKVGRYGMARARTIEVIDHTSKDLMHLNHVVTRYRKGRGANCQAALISQSSVQKLGIHPVRALVGFEGARNGVKKSPYLTSLVPPATLRLVEYGNLHRLSHIYAGLMQVFN